MRALSSGALPAIRDNKNAWKIAAEDLDRWSEDRTGPSPDRHRTMSEDKDRTTPSDTPETLAKLAAAEATVEQLSKQLDREQSAHQAEINRLTDLLDKALAPKPGIIERIAAAVRRS